MKNKRIIPIIIATALVASCTIGGAFVISKNAMAANIREKAVQTQYTTAVNTENLKQSSSVSTEQADEKIDKSYIYYHCLNTLEFLDQLSGNVEIRNGNQYPCKTEGTFTFDFEADLYYAEQTDIEVETNEISANYVFYNDKGNTLSLYDYAPTATNTEYGTTPGKYYELDETGNGPSMEGIVLASSEEDYYSTMGQDPTNAHMLAGCFVPQEMTQGYLQNFDNWEIIGTVEFEGRECSVIEGVAEESYGSRFGVKTFQICVDNETGIWMQYEGYDVDGTVQDYIYTSDMKFGDAVSAVPTSDTANLDGYVELD